MSTTIKRAINAAKYKRELGKNWLSRDEDPRYKIKPEKLIKIYGLTEDTIIELDLRGIITGEIRRQRKKEYVKNKRKSDPEAQERMKKALELSKQRHARNREILKHLSTGISIKQTAIDFGLSRQAIYNVLTAIKNAAGKVGIGLPLPDQNTEFIESSACDSPCQVACYY
jgi:hypothetical protein